MIKIKNNRGFSLLEIILVLAIAAVLIIGVFMVYPKVSSSSKVNNDTQLLSTLKAGIHSIWGSTNNFNGLSVDSVIKANLVPEDYLEDGEIQNNWGANVLIEPYYDGSYYIAFENISADACPKFVAAAAGSFYKIVIAGNEIKNDMNNLPLSIDKTALACVNNEAGYSNRPVTIFFYDK
ncbi:MULTISPECIES: type 4 pilus major pilin [Salmonella]|uniref:Prepilin-type N-terminal cleavage/methylation domain-containing protein n=1 Tax=Salmonella gallinarum TaxID=594 RepID=A0A752ICT5_SALGL|nr:type II secretion system protein [Salmonella enterica]MBZ5027196.1 prepilin-type N-terminal cleavage/methylation domain-containing protein [Salmonella enterica subsp. enterica serovar Typhimurium]HAF7491352.1 prepilin-type N-terminal cleavage/methylation domain-containing protein [Salmonella enterica subsp. enterica serovar Gallinarum]AZV12443.1 prepilin-type N-terminal cleavage/methylation domain-containing protein [Salmonella enterica subsp. enterica serovar Braenderup str. ATCC BAA-664]EA